MKSVCLIAASLAVGLAAAAAANAEDVVYVNKGWSARDRAQWYTTSQGSQLLPLKWIWAIERPDSSEAFLGSENVRRYGYLPAEKAGELPVGFAIAPNGNVNEPLWQAVKDTVAEWFGSGAPKSTTGDWVGLTCAACHTSEIVAQGRRLRIDGAGTQADFQTFFADLLAAMKATKADTAKFDRFADKVLGPSRRKKDTEQLRRDFETQLARRQLMYDRNKTPDATAAEQRRYGYARLDAVGHILNQIVVNLDAPDPHRPADAPVSYPFIWNAPQHDRVQWNGIAQNTPALLSGEKRFDLGALVRNTSEVLGVFAQVDAAAEFGALPSSADTANLIDLENLLGQLRSPRWKDAGFADNPDETPAVLARGKELYGQFCVGCHAILPSDDLRTTVKADMRPICDIVGQRGLGTDIWMAFNTIAFESGAGNLEGEPNLVPKASLGGPGLLGAGGRKEAGGLLLANVSARVILRQLESLLRNLVHGDWITIDTDELGKIDFGPFPGDEITQLISPAQPIAIPRDAEDEAQICASDVKNLELMRYKARPLNGIWATAPYLHNGSVPNLYELLLPSDQRSKSFTVGNLEFDDKRVGYVTNAAEHASMFRVEDEAGRAIKGNSNRGHEGPEYGTDQMDDKARQALVAYLKTL